MKFLLISVLSLSFLVILSQGASVPVVEAIKNKTVQDLAQESLDAGKQTKDILKADGESHENELVINDSEDDTNIIQRTIKFITRVIGTLGVFALVIGGYFMIISNGDEQRLSKGKSIVMYTVAGLLVAFLSYIIVQYVLSVIYGL